MNYDGGFTGVVSVPISYKGIFLYWKWISSNLKGSATSCQSTWLSWWQMILDVVSVFYHRPVQEFEVARIKLVCPQFKLLSVQRRKTVCCIFNTAVICWYMCTVLPVLYRCNTFIILFGFCYLYYSYSVPLCWAWCNWSRGYKKFHA